MKKLFPLVTVDIALFTVTEGALRVLLVRRGNDPQPGAWALPGGILKPDEDDSLDHAARRVLSSKTHVDIPYLEQVTTVSGPARDPRGWSISTLYYALLPGDQVPAVAGDAVDAVQWCLAHQPPGPLAFDHAALLDAAVQVLRERIRHGALPLHLLPARFTLTDVQRACEAVLGHALDKGAFRRQLKDVDALVPLEGEFLRGPQRPAQLYRAADDFSFSTRH